MTKNYQYIIYKHLPISVYYVYLIYNVRLQILHLILYIKFNTVNNANIICVNYFVFVILYNIFVAPIVSLYKNILNLIAETIKERRENKMQRFNQMTEAQMSKTNGGLFSVLMAGISLFACVTGLTASVTAGATKKK